MCKEKEMTDQAGIPTLGPVDILILEFSGNNFTGEIMRNLRELVEAGTIRVIDLVVIMKSPSGLITALELSEMAPEARKALAPLRASINEILTNDDIYVIGLELANNSTAAVLLYENTWAVKIKESMLAANGRLLAFERIPHQLIQRSLEDMAALSAAA
jgi:hypothetical protein